MIKVIIIVLLLRRPSNVPILLSFSFLGFWGSQGFKLIYPYVTVFLILCKV